MILLFIVLQNNRDTVASVLDGPYCWSQAEGSHSKGIIYLNLELVNLLQHMLCVDISERATISDVLSSEWLKG